MGISWKSETKAHIGSHKAKTNAEYFSKRILTPVIEKDVPRLCKGDDEKRRLAQNARNFLHEGKLWYIMKQECLGNSPDFNPLDCGIDADFKSLMSGQRAYNLLRLERMVKPAWNKCEPSTIQNVLTACLK